MALVRTLTKKTQNRRMYRTSSGRVYYRDSGIDTGGGTKTIRMSQAEKERLAKESKRSKFKPSQRMIWEARNYGIQFVQQKYKLSSSALKIIQGMNKAGGRAQGQSLLNAPPTARAGYVAQKGRLRDGGPSEPIGNIQTPRMLQLNLENDSGLAQGQHHPWAQSTTISSLITSQLRQAQNAPIDYFEAWAQDKGVGVHIKQRESSPFGIDVDINPAGPAGKLATGPMGAFGTNMVMDPDYTQDQEALGEGHTEDDGHGHGTTAEGDTYSATNMPDASTGTYNPWSEGKGGGGGGIGSGYEHASYGISPQALANSTLESMALANAYFAPQRMELAYALGDMETDMRRLAVNLGRQVDDPVLQAKLYKEGMRAVRTLDVQQNTLAFQMADQRRREEVANYQFYDQMAQQEYNLRLQNQQFMSRMELDNAYFGLKKDELDFMRDQAKPPTPNTSPVPGTENSPVGTAPTGQPTSPTAPVANAGPKPVGPGSLLKYFTD